MVLFPPVGILKAEEEGHKDMGLHWPGTKPRSTGWKAAMHIRCHQSPCSLGLPARCRGREPRHCVHLSPGYLDYLRAGFLRYLQLGKQDQVKHWISTSSGPPMAGGAPGVCSQAGAAGGGCRMTGLERSGAKVGSRAKQAGCNRLRVPPDQGSCRSPDRSSQLV